MNITGVQAQLSNSDLISIFDEFVKFDKLKINKVIIDDNIKIQGTLIMKVKVNFEVDIELLGALNNIITGRFSGFKIMKVGVFRPLRSLALKMALKQINVNGIIADKDKIEIDIKKILQEIPYIDVDIEGLFIADRKINVEVSNINLSIAGKLNKERISDEIIDKPPVLSFPIRKVQDLYSSGRSAVEKKMPDKIKDISKYIFVVPDIIALIYRLLKDKRVKLKTKIAIAGSIVYLALPVDLIPDFIPLIGGFDDLGVAFFALDIIVNEVSLDIILENWSGENNIILVLKKGIDFLTNYTAAKNVERLYNVVSEINKL